MKTETVIRFDPDGTGHCLYTEAVDLSSLGRLQMERATTIEFDEQAQKWQVRDLDGSDLFNSPSRGTCLNWERDYFNRKETMHR